MTTDALERLRAGGRPPSLPAGLRHDQRGAPLRLPLARLGLRPAGLPRPARCGRSSASTWAGRRSRSRRRTRTGFELDLVTHDARKFFGLLLKKNGYVLEQLYSPLVVHTTPEHEELKAIARGCVTRHHAHHYLGFAETQWRLFEKESPRRVKPLLYTYRVLLTGIHLMRTGEVEANLVRLNEEARLGHVDDLIARKLAGPEKSALDDGDVAFHRRRVRAAAGRTRSRPPGQHAARGAVGTPGLERPARAAQDAVERLRPQAGKRDGDGLLLDDDELERSAVVANCRMNRERGLIGSNGYDKELGLRPARLPQGAARLGRSGRLAGPLLRLGQGPDRGGDGSSRPRASAPDLDRRRRSGRDVPHARPRPEVPAARRGIADDLAARPGVRPDHLRPRPPLRRRQARADRPCRLVAGRRRAVRGESRPRRT